MVVFARLMATGFLTTLLFSSGIAGDTIAKIDNIRSDRIYIRGFELLRGAEFSIKGRGLRGYGDGDLVAYGWILDSDTREPVWVMDNGNTDRAGRKGIREADERISLDKGRYEVYYYASSRRVWNINIDGDNFFRFLGDLLKGELDADDDYPEDYVDEMYIEVQSLDGFNDYREFEPDGKIEDALIQLNRVGDSEYFEKGFSLGKDMEIRIYALCEYPKSYKQPVDHAWIVEEPSGEKVWTMDRWNTDPAGGGQKNRYCNEKVKFKKGRYILHYVTDDSHSYDEYNVMPPYDPLNWGVALLAVDKADRGNFEAFVPEGRGDPLISLVRLGDDDFESQAFQLKSDQSLRVVAIGEYSGWGNEFVDYGWIEDASSGRIVWEMTHRNTEHAGGASKNRKFEGLITLPKGFYIAHYITDDSHSYRDWNASAPYEPGLWGLSIYPGKDFKKSDFILLDESEVRQGAEILVKMTGLRDDVRKRSKFKLEKRTRLRIYAIGEGSDDEMYDYGWIVNDKTGRSVWDMTWRNTEPAGGARKNRMFDDTIILDAGEYEVYFVTDGSHSFNDWNAAKPRDPMNWGITVSKVEEFKD